jgi:hypothetical protein
MIIRIEIEVSVEHVESRAAVVAQLEAVLDKGVSDGEIDHYTIVDE